MFMNACVADRDRVSRGTTGHADMVYSYQLNKVMISQIRADEPDSRES